MNPGQDLLRKALAARGVTATVLAGRAGLHPSTVSFAVCQPWPSLELLHRYASMLGYEVHVCLRDPAHPETVIE